MNHDTTPSLHIAFIGGGNMARAILGGLRATMPASAFTVIEPVAALREALVRDFGVAVHETARSGAHASLSRADVVVWAVKPQSFVEAAAPCRAYVGKALHLSIMAGIRSEAVVRETGSEKIVRAMPNTPALIGQGIAGLVARPEVSAAQRLMVERVLAPTGQLLWLQREEQLDAVTALSGSGPAYVFYVLEALIAGGEACGLTAAEARQLALATLAGATALAAQSTETPAVLRERVTSKGGTTYAALEVLREREVGAAIQAAVAAANARARELGG